MWSGGKHGSMRIEKCKIRGFGNKAEAELLGILKAGFWISNWVIPCGV
jgi:hypothetical protein